MMNILVDLRWGFNYALGLSIIGSTAKMIEYFLADIHVTLRMCLLDFDLKCIFT